MGLIAADILVKTAIEAAIDHLKRNDWLLDDVFGALAADQLSKVDYGWKEVEAAKKWFKSNNILVTFPFRMDTPVFPCISVVNTSTAELTETASIGDEGNELGDFDPQKNALLPQMIYRPFTPKKYERAKGIVTMPDGISTEFVVPGQFLVSARSGKAYQIYKCIDAARFSIKEGTTDDFTDGYIVPPTSLWNVKRERTRISESFVIGCHASSDPVQCIWLRMLVQYILLRYKEAYFESRGFELSTFSASEVDLNPNFQGSDRIFSCHITLSGNVETEWIKYVAPKLQTTYVDIRIADGSKTPEYYYEKEIKDNAWKMPEDEPAMPEEMDGFTQVDDEHGALEDGIDQFDDIMDDTDVTVDVLGDDDE